jgi:hypothetical protein
MIRQGQDGRQLLVVAQAWPAGFGPMRIILMTAGVIPRRS